MTRTQRNLTAAAAVGVVAGGLLVVAADALRDDVYDFTASPASALNAISAESGGWTYSIPTDVAWQDARGTFHESGRPACLPPSGKEEGPVRIKAVSVDADGVKFRQVFFVECM